MNISEVYNTDCLEYMRTLPDKAFTLAIADPPYGIRDAGGQTGGSGKLKGRVFNNGYIDRWDKAPSDEFFNELRRVARNVIIWGGQLLQPAAHTLFHIVGQDAAVGEFLAGRVRLDIVRRPRASVQVRQPDGRQDPSNPETRRTLRIPFAEVCQAGRQHLRSDDGQSVKPYCSF